MSLYASSSWQPSLRQWLLGIVFTLSGALAWWQIQIHPDEAAPTSQRPRLPDYVALNFTALETDTDGRPSRRLVADELRHYVDERISELSQPRLTLFQPDGPPWNARSEQGIVLAGGEQIRLSGDVRLDRQGDRQTRATHLETERLDVWRTQALAETDLPVRIHSDGDVLTAKGMQLWYAEPMRATFQGRTQIRFAPEPETKP